MEYIYLPNLNEEIDFDVTSHDHHNCFLPKIYKYNNISMNGESNF